MAEISGELRDDGLPVGKPFKPGQSGNPGGRPKGLNAYRSMCREHTEEMLQVLYDIATGKDDKAKARDKAYAATVVLEHGWGKATQPVTGDDERPPVQLDLSRLSEKELEILARVIGPPGD